MFPLAFRLAHWLAVVNRPNRPSACFAIRTPSPTPAGRLFVVLVFTKAYLTGKAPCQCCQVVGDEAYSQSQEGRRLRGLPVTHPSSAVGWCASLVPGWRGYCPFSQPIQCPSCVMLSLCLREGLVRAIKIGCLVLAQLKLVAPSYGGSPFAPSCGEQML